jgi:drug/metabolite transporter (DMT)-like permease
MQAAALVFIWSTIIILPLVLLTGSGLPDIPLSRIVFHGVAQGFFSGFVATIAYGLAINRLGVPRAASFSVLVPVLATVLAVLWIGERPSALDAVALGIGTLGVAIVNGVFTRQTR